MFSLNAVDIGLVPDHFSGGQAITSDTGAYLNLNGVATQDRQTLTFGPYFSDSTSIDLDGTFGAYFTNINVTNAAGAVPEPATWAMMLVGFGMVGFGMRYRRKSQAAKVSFA